MLASKGSEFVTELPPGSCALPRESRCSSTQRPQRLCLVARHTARPAPRFVRCVLPPHRPPPRPSSQSRLHWHAMIATPRALRGASTLAGTHGIGAHLFRILTAWHSPTRWIRSDMHFPSSTFSNPDRPGRQLGSLVVHLLLRKRLQSCLIRECRPCDEARLPLGTTRVI